MTKELSNKDKAEELLSELSHLAYNYYSYSSYSLSPSSLKAHGIVKRLLKNKNIVILKLDKGVVILDCVAYIDRRISYGLVCVS